MSATRTSQLGWYARRAAAMSPAEVAWRARDQVLRAAWSPTASDAGATRCGYAATRW